MTLTDRRSPLLLSWLTMLLVLFTAGCSAVLSNQPASTLPVASATGSPTIASTSTQTPTPHLLNTQVAGSALTRTARPTRTPAPTKTATPLPSPTAPQIDASLVQFAPGTAIPNSGKQIRADNLAELVQVAQWGKGSIQRVIFSPDGQTMLAGSPFGIAVYAVNDLQQPLQWFPFASPVFFRDMRISTDGTLVRLQWPKDYPRIGMESRIYSLAAKLFQPADPSTYWAAVQDNLAVGYNGMTVISPDSRLRFEGYLRYQEENGTETFEGLIYDNQTGEQRFPLKDETFYVHYDDYNQPEGCDLASFSMCGNVYDPNIMAPYQAAFSDNGTLLAILYRAPNLGNSSYFSVLRVYSTKDGSMVSTFGSFDQPVQDFAFQPGSDHLSIAFVSGSIQIWNPIAPKLLHQTWDFRPPVMAFDFTSDGRYLLVQYSDSVEVLRTSDGAVAGRYEASAFALSPRENLLALGNKQGGIQVENLDQRKTVSHMTGHTAMIYALAFSPDGQTLTSSSQDCTIRSWDARTGTFQHYFEKAEVDAIGEGWTTSRIFVYFMHYVPGTDQMVGFGSWGTAASWNTSSGAKQYAAISAPLDYYYGMKTLNPHFPQSFWVVPEESRFYIDGIAYDLKSGQPVSGYTPPENLPEGCSPAGPRSADGSVRFTPGYGALRGQVCVLSEKDNRLLYRIPVFPSQTDGSIDIHQIYLSPDATRLFVVSPNGAIFVYQVQP